MVGAHAGADDLVGLGNLVLAATHELVRARVLAVLVPVHEAIARAGVRDAPRGRVVRVKKQLGPHRSRNRAKGHRAAQCAVARCRHADVLANNAALVASAVELARCLARNSSGLARLVIQYGVARWICACCAPSNTTVSLVAVVALGAGF